MHCVVNLVGTGCRVAGWQIWQVLPATQSSAQMSPARFLHLVSPLVGIHVQQVVGALEASIVWCNPPPPIGGERHNIWGEISRGAEVPSRCICCPTKPLSYWMRCFSLRDG